MTSQKSLKNNFGYAYRTGLLDNSLFAVLGAAALALFFCVIPILTFSNETQVISETGEIIVVNFKEQFSFFFTDSMDYMGFLLIAGLVGIGMLLGISAFRFITGKKTINVFYSLGIKRAKLFTAKFLSGATLAVCAVLVPMLVSLLVNIFYLGVNRYMIQAFFFLTLGMISIILFSFSLTAMVASLVGTVFETMLFSGILLLTPEILCAVLERLIQMLVLGTPFGTSFSNDGMYYTGMASTQSLAEELAVINPFRYFSNGLIQYTSALPGGQMLQGEEKVPWETPNFLLVFAWIAVSILIFFVGVYTYKRRKAEIGGVIGKNRVLNFIGTFVVSSFGFVVLLDILQSRMHMALAILISAVVFILISVGLSGLLLRNMRLIFKELRTLPIQLGIMAVILVFFATGYFGAANKIPEAEDISFAKITGLSKEYFDENTGSAYDQVMYVAGMVSPSTIPTGVYKSEADIEYVRSIHEKLIASGKTEPSVPDESSNGIHPVNIKIVYELKNGKQLLRCYYGVDEAILKELQKTHETDYAHSLLDQMFKEPLTPVEPPKNATPTAALAQKDITAYHRYVYLRAVRETGQINLYNKTLTTETQLELTPEQRAKLLDCLYTDLYAQSTENFVNPKTLGAIDFEVPTEDLNYTQQDNEMTVATSNGIEYGYNGEDLTDEDAFMGVDLNSGNPKFIISEDMTNTVAFLKSIGYYDTMLQTGEIESISIMRVAHQYRLSYMSMLIDNREDFPVEVLAQSYSNTREMYSARFDGYGVPTFTSTDVSILQTAEAACRLRGTVQPNDYIVLLRYADGASSEYLVKNADFSQAQKKTIDAGLDSALSTLDD